MSRQRGPFSFLNKVKGLFLFELDEFPGLPEVGVFFKAFERVLHYDGLLFDEVFTFPLALLRVDLLPELTFEVSLVVELFSLPLLVSFEKMLPPNMFLKLSLSSDGTSGDFPPKT